MRIKLSFVDLLKLVGIILSNILLTKNLPIKDLTTKEKVQNLFKMQQINFFKNIEDPLKWQKKQRNEW